MPERAPPVGIRLAQISATFRHPDRGEVPAVRDLDLEVRPGELMTLLGPSGCGKTTTLRMVAGFQEPSFGRIFIGDEDVTRLAANRRDIGFVFQNYALFPHLSLFENVAYGLRVRRKTESEIRSSVEAVLTLVGLGSLGRHSPAELSGGQQQRVALARAIVISPRVLLFDEPLSNLDAKLRVEMRGEIQKLQSRLGITTLYVTHDQEEAMAISDRIAVMREGRIAQLGSASDLYRRPTSTFVAQFIGRANMLRGPVLRSDHHGVTLGVGAHELSFPASAIYPKGTTLCAVIRPEAISLGPPDEGLPATLESQVYLGDKVEYALRLGAHLLQATRANPTEADRFESGQVVGLTFAREAVRVLEDGRPDEKPGASFKRS